MKNILVPTDFSKNALDAARFAAALAQTTGARLLLFHAYHVSMAVADAVIDLDLENFENFNQTQIDRLAYDLHKSYGISVTRIMRPGFAIDEIPGIAERLKADLIVMGMRGKSEKPEIYLGGTAFTLMQITKVPALCIPAGYSFETGAGINAAIDPIFTYSGPGTEVVTFLLQLLKLPTRAGGLETKNMLEPAR